MSRVKGFRVEGLGFGVWGSRFSVQGWGLDLKFRA
jgi:hypothetical protein